VNGIKDAVRIIRHRQTMLLTIILLLTLVGVLSGCDKPWNHPYPVEEATKAVLYTSFAEQPKTLDPAKSYSSNEYQFLGLIYEPPLQYHYLLRPYQLEPLTAAQMPVVEHLQLADGQVISRYTIHIKPGVFYQPHPALAVDEQGGYLYHQLDDDYLAEHHIDELADFARQGTRELTAADYVYQIKRLAHPEVQSPILGLMGEHIVGLQDYAAKLNTAYRQRQTPQKLMPFIDLRDHPLAGVRALDRYTYQIDVYDHYPQFLYWLAMPFFAPMPWEADLFDSQPGMVDNNLTLDWYPLGTGPMQLIENNPNRAIILVRNPYYHADYYPAEGEEGDAAAGLLVDAGKPLPMVDKIVFALEKEAIPRWTKFLQGYYDNSGIGSDSFDQAITLAADGKPELTKAMQAKDMRLYTEVEPAIYYIGFNMLDEVVGGDSQRARKLRQAISILLDYEEFVSIFLNGRGIAAHGPVPPGIFGYQTGAKGVNPYVYDWRQGEAKRKSLAQARQLLADAGYPNGRDARTGKSLMLNYDTPVGSGSDDKALFDWLRKQFSKLGIQLNIRATQYNRFQQKMRTGNAQLFTWGWQADYPDPENFLFLLYGSNGKVKHGGENAANYQNPKYDVLFEQMRDMPNSPERLALISQMVALLQRDAPWVWGFHPKTFTLAHRWNRISKPSAVGVNMAKYTRLNPELREQKRREWNKPVIWPLFAIVGLLVLLCLPLIIHYWRKEHRPRYR
jgi:peptide/nickel transport system substrate-binding protein